MLTHEALKSIGKVVEIYTEYDGFYIGELLKVNSGMCNTAEVKILACTRYPGQRAIFYTFNNYERWPFQYEFLKTFNIDCIEPFYGAIPEYYELMPRVLEETFLIETEADREIFERHKKYWEGKRGTYGKTVQGIT